MFLLVTVCLFVGALAVALLLWLFSRLDCDLQLLFAEKLGRPVTELRGKVVWITGASSGIGESLAYILASAGVRLALSGTNQSRLEAVRRQCIVCGQLDERDVLVVRFDIADTGEHQRSFDTVIKRFGTIDILVNNAGRTQRASFADIDIAVDRQLFEINVFGLVSLTRIVLRYFLENGIAGQFVVTSSTAGKLGVPNSSSYTASKHALHGYFECLRTEAQSRGIAVTMTCPGPVFSRIGEKAFSGESGKNAVVHHEESNRRMATQRCAHLVAVATVNRLDEAWICIQPILALYYFFQYMPTVSRRLFPIFATPERFAKLREGHT